MQEVFIADIEIKEDQAHHYLFFSSIKLESSHSSSFAELLKHTMNQGHKHTLSGDSESPRNRIPQRARRGGGPWRRIGDPPAPQTFEPPERSPSPTLPALSLAGGSHASLAGPSSFTYTAPTDPLWDPFIYSSVPRLVLPPPPSPPPSSAWLAYAEHQDEDGVGGSEEYFEHASEEHQSYSYPEYDDGDDEEPANDEEEEEEDSYYENGNEEEDSYDGEDDSGEDSSGEDSGEDSGGDDGSDSDSGTSSPESPPTLDPESPWEGDAGCGIRHVLSEQV